MVEELTLATHNAYHNHYSNISEVQDIQHRKSIAWYRVQVCWDPQRDRNLKLELSGLNRKEDKVVDLKLKENGVFTSGRWPPWGS